MSLSLSLKNIWFNNLSLKFPERSSKAAKDLREPTKQLQVSSQTYLNIKFDFDVFKFLFYFLYFGKILLKILPKSNFLLPFKSFILKFPSNLK
jgi:hypothetical protein